MHLQLCSESAPTVPDQDGTVSRGTSWPRASVLMADSQEAAQVAAVGAQAATAAKKARSAIVASWR